MELLAWLEDVLGALCDVLAPSAARPALDQFRTTIRESVDAVLLALIDAMESDDRATWKMVTQHHRRPEGDDAQGANALHGIGPSTFKERDLVDMLLITNAVEEVFFVLSKLAREYNVHCGSEEHARVVRLAQGGPDAVDARSTARSIADQVRVFATNSVDVLSRSRTKGATRRAVECGSPLLTAKAEEALPSNAAPTSVSGAKPLGERPDIGHGSRYGRSDGLPARH